jgi:hypothetical protein
VLYIHDISGHLRKAGSGGGSVKREAPKADITFGMPNYNLDSR